MVREATTCSGFQKDSRMNTNHNLTQFPVLLAAHCASSSSLNIELIECSKVVSSFLEIQKYSHDRELSLNQLIKYNTFNTDDLPSSPLLFFKKDTDSFSKQSNLYVSSTVE